MTNYLHNVSLGFDPVVENKHTWGSIADWCSLLMGPIDGNWTMWYDEKLGMMYGFKNQNDAWLFRYAWK